MLTRLSQFETDDLIKVRLENTEKVYYLQPAVLRLASPYFEKAVTNGFKESEDKTLRLPGCDVDTFEGFLYWLCHKDIPDDTGENVKDSDSYHQFLIRVWAFGDVYLMPLLQNEAMNHLLGAFDSNWPSPRAVKLAFELSSPGSIVREVLVEELADMYKRSGNDPDEEVEPEMNKLGATAGFTLAFTNALMNALRDPGWQPPSDRDPWRYMIPEERTVSRDERTK